MLRPHRTVGVAAELEKFGVGGLMQIDSLILFAA